ncbi:MAG TPA: alpha/beta family hydrolase [Alphaproteobacteria bacterium]|jgi:dienelactone hydrolase|nr:alpha/beta family hydrolase [Alphaproteobacteria bacterium]
MAKATKKAPGGGLRIPPVETVQLPPLGLEGLLTLPEGASGLVLFAHGSGSSRLSPRNTYVARALQAAGLGTLLFDLLSETEADDRRRVFDIPLLAERLLAAAQWAERRTRSAHLPIGFFGASTGAAAALVAAARTPLPIAAVVSRGGRPDLAGASLPDVRAPTLLIVGGDDIDVLALNRAALAELTCEKALEVVPGASHLFEEPGTLDRVIDLARSWFTRHLIRPDTA